MPSLTGTQRQPRLGIAALAALAAWGCGGATSEDTSVSPSFVAVGARGTIVSSLDGTSWTPRDSGVTAKLTGVAASGALFVAVGDGGTILSSSRGTAWAARDSGTEVNLTHVIFNGEKFVAVGGGWSDQAVSLTSPDGISWTSLESPSAYAFHAVAVAGGTVFAAAVTPSTRLPMDLEHVVLEYVLPSTSSRGSWRDRDLPRFSDSLSLAEQALTVGSWNDESTLSRSSDGQDWTTQALPCSDARAVASSGSTLVVACRASALSSPDGTAWSEHSLAVDGGWLTEVTYGASSFVAVGSAGAIFTSANGSTWTSQVSGVSADLLDVAYGAR
jgi:hypothetical protein